MQTSNRVFILLRAIVENRTEIYLLPLSNLGDEKEEKYQR